MEKKAATKITKKPRITRKSLYLKAKELSSKGKPTTALSKMKKSQLEEYINKKTDINSKSPKQETVEQPEQNPTTEQKPIEEQPKQVEEQVKPVEEPVKAVEDNNKQETKPSKKVNKPKNKRKPKKSKK